MMNKRSYVAWDGTSFRPLTKKQEKALYSKMVKYCVHEESEFTMIVFGWKHWLTYPARKIKSLIQGIITGV